MGSLKIEDCDWRSGMATSRLRYYKSWKSEGILYVAASGKGGGSKKLLGSRTILLSSF